MMIEEFDTERACPRCNGDKFNIFSSMHDVFVECISCGWGQTPSNGYVILAAIATHRHIHHKEASENL